MDEVNAQNERLPPSTVPAHVQLSLLGLGADTEWNQRFQQSLVDLIKVCGRFMDLQLLDGVTVGFDYDDALESVDLGYESATAKGYTNSNGLIGVGKTLRVRRKDQVRAHIVLNANVLSALADSNHEEFLPTANIVAHELAHVVILGWFEEHSPNVMLHPHAGDWATATLRDIAHTVWEEYAACRISAIVGSDVVEQRYAKSVDQSIQNAFSKAREQIKAYRLHGEVDQLLVEVAGSLSNPLKMAAYLLGHLDGTERDIALLSLCPAMRDSEFAPFIPNLLSALRDVWETRHDWSGLAGVDPIVQSLLEVFAQGGIIVTLSEDNPGSRVDAPFTAETMPNPWA